MLTAVSLSACRTFTPLPAQGEPPRAEWHNSQLPVARWQEHWREQLGSLRLNMLVDSALQGNFGVAATQERLRAARIVQGAGAAQYTPEITLQTASQPTPEVTENHFQAGVETRWEPPLFGRGRKGDRIVAAQTADAEANLAAACCALTALDCEIEVDAPNLRVGQQVLVRFFRGGA